MDHRILSRLKYDRERGFSQGNFSYSMQVVIKELGYETFLTRYPYIEEDVPEHNRWIPDYVIRKSTLNEDITDLLHVLGCANIELKAVNTHTLDPNTTTFVLNKIEKYLTTSDFRYRTDMETARKK